MAQKRLMWPPGDPFKNQGRKKSRTTPKTTPKVRREILSKRGLKRYLIDPMDLRAGNEIPFSKLKRGQAVLINFVLSDSSTSYKKTPVTRLAIINQVNTIGKEPVSIEITPTHAKGRVSDEGGSHPVWTPSVPKSYQVGANDFRSAQPIRILGRQQKR